MGYGKLKGAIVGLGSYRGYKGAPGVYGGLWVSCRDLGGAMEDYGGANRSYRWSIESYRGL